MEDFVIIITKREETNNKSPIVLRTLYRGYIIILRKRNKAKASRLSNLRLGDFLMKESMHLGDFVIIIRIKRESKQKKTISHQFYSKLCIGDT